MKIMRISIVSTIITLPTAAAMVTIVSSIIGTRVVVLLSGDGVGVMPAVINTTPSYNCF